MQENRMNLGETANTVYLIVSLFKWMNVSTTNKVTYLTHSVSFLYWLDHEKMHMNLCEIANTACRIKSLFNDQMEPKSIQ